MTHSPVLLLLDALAVFRLTRLAILDTVTAGLRELLIGRRYTSERFADGSKMPVWKRPKVGELLTCPWCVSPHMAGLVVLLQTFAPAVCLYFSAVLAFSAVAGLLSERV